MGLNKELQRQHADLIKTVDGQEQQAIKELKEKFSVMRLGVDQAFGIERPSAVGVAGLEVEAGLGVDEDVPMDTKALGATS